MKTFRCRIGPAIVAGLFACCSTAAGDKAATIVFSGTVLDVAMTRTPASISADRAVRVRVDYVHDKPASVALQRGSIVVVESTTPEAFQSGMQATFHTRGLVFADRIYLGEVSHEVITDPTTVPQMEASMQERQQEAEDKALKERLDAAAMVFCGNVKLIREPANALTTEEPAISEHAPLWKEALIQCDRPIKGVERNQQVVVRFPASRDIMWAEYPKLANGQHSLFILTPDALNAGVRTRIGDRPVPAYMLDSRGDVLPESAIERCRRLLQQ